MRMCESVYFHRNITRRTSFTSSGAKARARIFFLFRRTNNTQKLARTMNSQADTDE